MVSTKNELGDRNPYQDDEFLDWETRQDHIPFWKHCVAGKTTVRLNVYRLLRWHR